MNKKHEEPVFILSWEYQTCTIPGHENDMLFVTLDYKIYSGNQLI